MKNKYEITRYGIKGTQFIEVRGVSFCCEDLYEIVGKNQFMSTFGFKTGTDALNKFGQSVTGVIYYHKDELSLFHRDHEKRATLKNINVKIDSPMRELTLSQREDLKYGGISASDIEYVSFIPYGRK